MLNRGCLYGDGFFETLWVNDNQVPLLAYHYRRAKQTAEKLQIEWPENLTEEVLKAAVIKNCGEGTYRCRITFYREGGGQYIPQNNKLAYFMESSPYELPAFASGVQLICQSQSIEELNNACKELPMGKAVYYEMHKKNNDQFASLKSISAQFYVQAGVFTKSKEADDAVLFNKEFRAAELLLGNLIVVKNNQWYTPGLEQGGVDGVLRACLLDKFAGNITLTPLNKSHMENADLLLGCNALRGLYRLQIAQ